MKTTNEENTHWFKNGTAISCLCGKHKEDSKCEVYLRNANRHNEPEVLFSNIDLDNMDLEAREQESFEMDI